MFSGVNHLKVCSVLGEEFADTFGITQPEVVPRASTPGSRLLVDWPGVPQGQDRSKWMPVREVAGG